MSLSADYIRTSLQNLYGESVTSADIRAWCAMNGGNYQTITNKLSDYKVGRGKWNLTIQEKLEQTYQAPPAMPAVEQIQAAMNIATKQASSNSEAESNENKNFGHGQNNLIGGKRKNSGSHSSVDLQDAYSNHLSKKLRLLLDNSH